MKVAIIQDELVRRGGAEQVVLSMLKAFPGAHIYTLCYNKNTTFPEYKNYLVRTSFFQNITTNARKMQFLFFPFGIVCMLLMKIRNYDIVIISNTHCAKYVSIDKKSLVFIYTYTPFRLVWNPNSYTEYIKRNGLSKFFINNFLNLLKILERSSAKKGHFHLGMTTETAQRIKDAYLVNEVKIIPPPVKLGSFKVSSFSKDYYLVVSRLEFYKKIDIVIDAFNELNLPLIIVGNGSKFSELKKMVVNDTITFKSGLSSEELSKLYTECKAFIFPQHEDYGITPLEANASGKPVIAYKAGGVLETMIPYSYSSPSKKFTAVFFESQTKESLIEAVKNFQEIKHIDQDFIYQNAVRFSEENFINKLTDFIKEKVNDKFN